MELTQEYLKSILHYDPETGVFVWAKTTSNKSIKGNTTGSPDTKGYKRIMVNKKHYFAHRLAFLYMTGSFPNSDTDHINGDKGDNRWSNLRAVSRTINSQNMSRRSNNSSGCTGVCRVRRGRKWRAEIKVNKKAFSLGEYHDWFEAVCARKSAEVKYGFHPNHGRA